LTSLAQAEDREPPSNGGMRTRLMHGAPWFLLGPGILWLAILFIFPTIWMLLISLSSGDIESGFRLTFTTSAYSTALSQFSRQFVNSITFGSIATVLCFVIGFPVAYTIAFRGGRYKNLILFLVIAPFFTSFLIRTISWKILLGDNGPLLSWLKVHPASDPNPTLSLLAPDFSLLGGPVAVIAGLTYNFLPFMILPLYVSLEKIPMHLIEASHDLYAGRWGAFRNVTLPLALPGVFAGSLLTFIPALGDYVNADLLGDTTTRMIGNVIQSQFFLIGNYQVPAALSFILMAAIFVGVFFYARALGTEQLTG
jgi:spermidine/putrescine transport system permease protein